VLLCRFRVDDDLVWNLLIDHGTHHNPARNPADMDPPTAVRSDHANTSRMHANILMAGRFAEAL
jgi:flagellar transcriptional activator FlhD